MNNVNVVFTGGGTGGHIYPGLAIIEEFIPMLKVKYPNENFIFHWIGTNNGRDKEIVMKSGLDIDFYSIPSGKLRRYFSFQNFIDIFKIIGGYIKSFYLLKKLKVDFVFSKGGYVTVPTIFWADKLDRIVFTHECDYSPGLATRLNAKHVQNVFVSYPETKQFFPEDIQEKVIVTGNPVRPQFYHADKKRGREFLKLDSLDESVKKLPVLLILGGSLGSRQINELVWNNLDWLCERFIVVHQTGKKDFQQAGKYKAKNPKAAYLPYEFIFGEIPDVIAASDIVVSRSGANFLCECAVIQKPLLLIPLSTKGSRGDQLENAKFYESKGAATVLYGEDANDENFRTELEKLTDENIRKQYSENCKKLMPEENPAVTLAKILLKEI